MLSLNVPVYLEMKLILSDKRKIKKELNHLSLNKIVQTKTVWFEGCDFLGIVNNLFCEQRLDNQIGNDSLGKSTL